MDGGKSRKWRMKIGIGNLSDEVFIRILTYLRAVDLASAREVDKTIFSSLRVSAAVHLELNDYTSFGGVSPQFKIPSVKISDLLRPDILYLREISSIIIALNNSPPPFGKGLKIKFTATPHKYYLAGYWISTSWVANAKKHFDALVLPELEGNVSVKKGGKRKNSKIRQRRGSDTLPPWPAMNADLLCPHDNLSLTNGGGLKGRRRSIDSRSWFLLRKFYPHGPTYKCSTASECDICFMEKEEAKANAVGKKEAELQVRRNDYIPSDLEALSVRKCGVPVASITSRVDMYTSDAFADPKPTSIVDNNFTFSSASSFENLEDSFFNPSNFRDDAAVSFQQPLVPGLYNLVPRGWLKSWRRYTKDPDLTSLPALDCSSLFCSSHGKNLFAEIDQI